MLAILFQEKTKKMLVFPKNAEKNASTIEKGLVQSILVTPPLIVGFDRAGNAWGLGCAFVILGCRATLLPSGSGCGWKRSIWVGHRSGVMVLCISGSPLSLNTHSIQIVDPPEKNKKPER